MNLLIARKITTNEVVCRCDARCYNAHHEECIKCCCAGLNHAQGEDRARTNSLTLSEQMQTFVHSHFGPDVQLVVNPSAIFQLELPQCR